MVDKKYHYYYNASTTQFTEDYGRLHQISTHYKEAGPHSKQDSQYSIIVYSLQ